MRFNRSTVLWILFAFYILFILELTLLCGQGQSELRLVPFEVIGQQFQYLFSGYPMPFLFNVVGNILMFVPMGFFLPLLKKLSFPKTVLCGFLFSLFIELAQLPLDRVTDVDDLILNTTGTAVGFGFFIFAKHLYKIFQEYKKHRQS
ncbi:MAG: VanZ family protein [Acutalibacteraceae bacterium]